MYRMRVREHGRYRKRTRAHTREVYVLEVYMYMTPPKVHVPYTQSPQHTRVYTTICARTWLYAYCRGWEDGDALVHAHYFPSLRSQRNMALRCISWCELGEHRLRDLVASHFFATSTALRDLVASHFFTTTYGREENPRQNNPNPHRFVM